MADLINELRHVLVSSLRLDREPESIDANTYLFGKELGLDSVDAVQLVAAIENRFEVDVTDGELARFPLATLATIAELLRSKGVGG